MGIIDVRSAYDKVLQALEKGDETVTFSVDELEALADELGEVV